MKSAFEIRRVIWGLETEFEKFIRILSISKFGGTLIDMEAVTPNWLVIIKAHSW